MKAENNLSLAPIDMIRCYNNLFFYVEVDLTSRNSNVIMIDVKIGKNSISYSKSEVFSVSAANIFCMQHDTSSESFDSIWTRDGVIIPQRVESQ